MSTSSNPAHDHLALWLSSARASRRVSGNGATPTEVSTVENGVGGHRQVPPGQGIERGRTSPVGEADQAEALHTDRRYSGYGSASSWIAKEASTDDVLGTPQSHLATHDSLPDLPGGASSLDVETDHQAQELTRKKNKANHGKRPNAGRG